MKIDDFNYQEDFSYKLAIILLKNLYEDLKKCEDYEEDNFYVLKDCIGIDIE